MTGAANLAPTGKVFAAKMLHDIVLREWQFALKERFVKARNRCLQRQFFGDTERISPTSRPRDLHGIKTIRPAA